MFTSIPHRAKTNTSLPPAGTGGHPRVSFFPSQNMLFSFFFLLAKHMQQTTPACFIFSMYKTNSSLTDIGPAIWFSDLTSYFWTDSIETQTS